MELVLLGLVVLPAALGFALWLRLRRRGRRILGRVALAAGITGSAGMLVISLALMATRDEAGDLPPIISGTPPGARPDPVAEFIRDRMQPAAAAFFVPSPLRRDEPDEAVLEIAPPDVEPSQLEAELQGQAKRAGVAVSESIRIAPRLVANLVADRDASIVAKDELDRAVTFGERTRWRWTVTPKTREPLTLTVTLRAPVIVDGRETGYAVTSFEKTVSVTVTTGQRVADAWDWSKENWVLLSAVFAGAAAGVRMVRGRRPKARVGF